MMRSKTTSIIMPSIILGIILSLGCWRVMSSASKGEEIPIIPDSISGASKSMTVAANAIPENPHYEVIGEVDGIKGVVIRYNDELYRGGNVTSKDGMMRLKKQGIQTIIAVTPSPEQREWADAAGIGYTEVSFDYNEVPKDLQVVVDNIFRTSPGPFYVHCHGGSTRGGALCMLYRMNMQSWSYERSLIEFGRLGGSLAKSHDLTASLPSRPSDNNETDLEKGGQDD